MRFRRLSLAAIAAAAIVIAGGCKSTTSTTTTTPQASSATSTDTTYGTSNTSSSRSTASTSTTTYSTSTPSTTTTVASTSTDQNGATTTVMPDGTSVTKAVSTTVVYPDGRVEKLTGEAANTATTPVPAGASVVTKTTMTVTTKPAEQSVTTTAAAPQLVPIYITTTPANIYATPPGMTSSSTTIYQPAPSLRGRRFPNVNFLVFTDRASFSNDNNSLSGTVNTGAFGADIRNQEGWGLGFNTYLGRTNLSTEFTASQIRPRATLTPANSTFNPINDLRIKMTPITGALQLHWNPRSSVDFYVGGGGAYVMLKPDNSFNPGTTGLTSVRFRDEWGPLVNAGLGFGFSPNFGINFDAKYMWVRANATTTFTEGTIANVGNSERIGLNPFVVSAGLRFGF
jgi:outer membrane protein W